MYWVLTVGHCHGSRIVLILSLLALTLVLTPDVSAQGASNDIGNGGRHSIQGRLYVSTGRRSQVSGLKIRLTSSSAGDISIITDETGTFMFRNLNAGSYTVTIEGAGIFENASENVVIDDLGSSSIRSPVRMRAAPRVVNVQIYLRPAASEKRDAAVGVLNAKWSGVPRKAVEHFERGLELVRAGNDREAEVEFRSSLEISPSFAPAHTEFGRILQRGGNLLGAVEAWKNAIRYDQSDFTAHVNLGVAYLNLKKYDEAEGALVSAALLDRSAVTPHYYLGLIYVEKKDLNIAQAAFEKARDLTGDKSFPVLHKYLGGVYMAKNMNAKAVTSLETYIKQDPKAKDADRIRQTILDLKNK